MLNLELKNNIEALLVLQALREYQDHEVPSPSEQAVAKTIADRLYTAIVARI